MVLKRRSLLKQMGISTGVLMLSQDLGSEMPFLNLSLAESTERKLALLIGINKYTNVANLKGAVTDVELQRDLLINRFGFQSQDILTLTDTQATREAIETAFLEHLTLQARKDDLVLVHYSGYGREVTDPEGKLVSTLAVVDKDILESTLMLLVRTLKTSRFTIVLDTSFYWPGKPLQGDLRIRSHPETQTTITPLEYALQNQLLSQNYKLTTSLKGVILLATQNKQVAAEITVKGFSAGLFTYALTQYLWEVSPASRLWMTLQQTSQTVATLQPQQQPQVIGSKETFLSYFATPQTSNGAEAIVTAIDKVNNNLEIKLTGLSFNVFLYSRINSCYSSVSDDSLIIQLKSVDGQMAKGRLLGNLPLDQTPLVAGSLLQEAIRVMSRSIPLVIALDSSLERIERVDATSALSTLPLSTSIVHVGEITADCLLSKLPKQTEPSTDSSTYALFTPSGQLIPIVASLNSNDALKSAIGRLIPQLKQLLALKLWRLTVNSYSSRLPVRLTLEKIEEKGEEILISQETRGKQDFPLKKQNSVISLPIGSRIQYKIENLTENPLTVFLVGLNPIEGTMTTFLTTEAISKEETYLKADSGFIMDSLGYREIYVICAQSSFETTKKLLETKEKTTSPNLSGYSLDLAQCILEDLNKISNQIFREGGATVSDFYTLDLKKWVTFSFVYQVV